MAFNKVDFELKKIIFPIISVYFSEKRREFKIIFKPDTTIEAMRDLISKYTIILSNEKWIHLRDFRVKIENKTFSAEIKSIETDEMKGAKLQIFQDGKVSTIPIILEK